MDCKPHYHMNVETFFHEQIVAVTFEILQMKSVDPKPERS